MAAAFSPNRLGAASALTVTIVVATPEHSLAPVSAVQLSFPVNLGLATSGLGVASCPLEALQQIGSSACPPNSKMGAGEAAVDVAFGADVVHERVSLELYAAPSSDGYIHMAVLVHGQEPILASVVLGALLLPGQLQITVPPIESIPGAPDVSLVSMRATLGGALTYYERVHGRTVAYRPQGIGLPDSCPRGGWKLAASFAFTDGRSSLANTAVPCPRGHLSTGR